MGGQGSAQPGFSGDPHGQFRVDLCRSTTGNHDATERLSFAATLLRGSGLHIADSALGRPIPMRDRHGEVWILPYGYA